MKRCKTLPEAKAFFKKKTGVPYDNRVEHHSGIKIFKRKKTKKSKFKCPYLVGTWYDWLST